jgi:hypothetical protein
LFSAITIPLIIFVIVMIATNIEGTQVEIALNFLKNAPTKEDYPGYCTDETIEWWRQGKKILGGIN